MGSGSGRLNGVDVATVEFIFVDAGKPGRDDMAEIKISDSSGVVLYVPLQKLNHGNLQDHFDQPHN